MPGLKSLMCTETPKRGQRIPKETRVRLRYMGIVLGEIVLGEQVDSRHCLNLPRRFALKSIGRN